MVFQVSRTGAAYGSPLSRGNGRKRARCYIVADMIYLKNKTGRQGLRVPVSGLGEAGETPVLRLRSTTGNRDVYDAGWQDGVAETGYLRGTVGLPAGLPDGEYEYELAQEGQTLGRGVAQVGDYRAVPVQESNETITFNQYGRKN